MHKIYFIFIVILTGVSCQNKTIRFHGETAYKYLEKQCELGPRNPGSQGHKQAKQMYIDFFQKLSDTTYTQKFTKYIPKTEDTLKLTNIISTFAPKKGNPILLGAHWDTRPRAERDPDPSKRNQAILGANDGASGVAVLMHLAELIQKIKLDRTIQIVLFDGEDYGFHGQNKYWALGSKYFVQHMPTNQPREVIIVDMIGDAQLSLPMERYSYNNSKALTKKLWKIADSKGYSQFKYELGTKIYDDHVPFIKAGIPAVDIIDFHYPNRYTNYWHTTQDTPDKCSPKSLEVVGQVLLEYITKGQNE